MFLTKNDIKETIKSLSNKNNFNKKYDLQQSLQKTEIGKEITIITKYGNSYKGIVEWEPLKTIKRKYIKELNMLNSQKVESEIWQENKLIIIKIK